MLPVAHNKSNARRGIVAVNGAPEFERPEPEPVTLALTDPIVGVGTPACVTKACAPDASWAKPMDAGLARKTL